MFGNVLNNAQIRHLLDTNKDFMVDPFDPDKLRLAHYPLHVGRILDVGAAVGPSGQRQVTALDDFANNKPCSIAADQYVVVEVLEKIKLPDGIVGHFVPASGLIEAGYGITAGKLDPGYGTLRGKQQKIRFGLKNLRSQENLISEGDKIAHIYFVDLRGLNNLRYDLTHAEVVYLLERFPRLARDADSGIHYGDGSGEAGR